ncbi:ACP S-malonyltransferase [Limosilactobacillus walteri]|uniref:Malonyl CoA-acyl carrier protein transacylase n=1 Tax=Limosilactobacillus walteri TaxID=2268022 RepID=A0ABR8P945_9LACO|nr:ACP S-malonyltransferase [Limosilactobacillus walteri]MBD5807258.1 ACP S-malonyltransferase [Limosilactobacillus walteri]
MRYGILFSGQGAQRSGMGVELMADSLFSKIITEASELINLDLFAIMKNEHGELNKTEYVQPALVAVSYGIYRMLERDLPNLPIKGMIGLSLGEYAALFASKAISFSAGMQLLTARAEFMQADADKVDSTLAAILNPEIHKIEDLCHELRSKGKQIYVANYNSPAQLVIGGIISDVQEAVTQIEQKGLAKRTVVLKVNGAFHTPLFNGAQEKMHQQLQNVNFITPTLPVISNTTVMPFEKATINLVLERQLAVPTHYGAGLQYLIEHQQIDTTLEIGPGKTLTRFAKQISPQLKTSHISDLDSYQKFIKEYRYGSQR